MSGLISGALLAGAFSSPHCVGMCGPFAAASSRSGTAAWHLGRLATYAALGALSGTVGRLIPGPSWVGSAVAGLMTLWFALSLAGVVKAPAVSVPGLRRFAAVGRRADLPSRFAFGVVTSLLPCGMLWSAAGLAMAADGATEGAAMMAAFWLGTTPLLALVSGGLRVVQGRGLWVRRVVAVCVLIAGWGAIAGREVGAHEASVEAVCQ